MKELIRRHIRQSIKVKKEILETDLDAVVRIAKEIIKALSRKRKVIFFGNGGSAADSQHLAAEFVGRYQKNRKPLSAVALTTNTSILTALGNDYNFDIIFAKQLEAIGVSGDVAVAISTSGNSKDVIEGVKQAKKMGIKTLSLTGCGGGRLVKISDVSFIAPSRNTAKIQEAHICVGHAICELVENNFYKK